MNQIDNIMELADQYARICAINTIQHSEMEVRKHLRAAIEQALGQEYRPDVDALKRQRLEAAEKWITAQLTAPQPQPKQEPVKLPCCGYYDATAIKWNQFNGVVQCHNCGESYAPQPQREWVGLTNHERAKILAAIPAVPFEGDWHGDLIDAIEAKLREKNGGGV